MMYPFMTLDDETEIVHSEMRPDGTASDNTSFRIYKNNVLLDENEDNTNYIDKTEKSTDKYYVVNEKGNKSEIAQIYVDGILVADEFYYGVPWHVPARLLYGKECYLVMSEIKYDFYRGF